MAKFKPKSAQEAWERIRDYTYDYYQPMAALYSGNHKELQRTGDVGSFWRRNTKQLKVHVPLAADIASASADLLFSEEPRLQVFDNLTELSESPQQTRLDEILEKNNLYAKFNEGAETASAMGDVYFKVRWSNKCDYPKIELVQPDAAYPEYVDGELMFVHFFSVVQRDIESGEVIRMYQLYTEDEIRMEVYVGTDEMLGSKQDDALIRQLGYEPVVAMPVKGLAATHIANVRPNKRFRQSMMGRSDLDGLRDLCDALDETYSSWMRDVRLAKARLIVPVDYLRRKPEEMLDGVAKTGSWEFDPDIETYVAMDMDVDRGASITPSQFAIRSSEHAMTCSNIVHNIIQLAGFSPQTFGIDVGGANTSGTALALRERKSAATKNKKQQYWQYPMEKLLTLVIQLDEALYPESGSNGKNNVKMIFSDGSGASMNDIAGCVATLVQSHAVSTLIKVRMLHPDWSEKQVGDEVARIRADYGAYTEAVAEDVLLRNTDLEADKSDAQKLMQTLSEVSSIQGEQEASTLENKSYAQMMGTLKAQAEAQKMGLTPPEQPKE